MRVGDVIKRVRDSGGDTNALQFTDDMIIDWINDSVREVAIQNNLLQKTATTATVVGQDEYTMPPDILKLYSVVVDGSKIPVKTLQEWEELNAGDMITQDADRTTGRVFQCYSWAGKLVLFPKPDQSMVLKVNYIFEPDPIKFDDTGAYKNNEIPLPVGYHSRIVSYCIAQVALQDDDVNKYQAFMNEFNTGVQALREQHNTEEDLYPFISVSSRDQGGFDFGDVQW